MHPEVRNVTNLAKHVVRSAMRGRIGEAGAGIRVLAMRLSEAGMDALATPAVTCEFCGWSGHRYKTFLTGASYRRDALCPRCLSLERHREFVRLFGRLRPLLPLRVRILDIAPTQAFSAMCRDRPDVEYVSFDLVSPLAMVRGDVQRLPFRPESFDVVLCSHVLDYVADDVCAMREMRAALRAGGLAILEHHLQPGVTDEWRRPLPDALYRVRQYGTDFADRMSAAGLDGHRAGMGSQVVFLAFKGGSKDRMASFMSAVAR